MNSLHLSGAVCAALSLLTSCQLHPEPAELQPEETDALVEMTFHLSDGARTSLAGTDVLWEETDLVSVFDGKGNRRFAVSGAGTTTDIRGRAGYAASYTLAYPYDAEATLSGSTLSMLLPEVQRPVPDGFDAAANLLCAITSNGTALMKNVCGLLRFTLSGTDVCAVQFIPSGTEKICGRLTLSLSSGTPSVSAARNGMVTACPVSGTCFTPGNYYLSLVPGTLASGFRVRISYQDGSVRERRFTAPLTITRSATTTIKSTLDDPAALTAFDEATGDLTPAAAHPRLFAGDAEFRSYKEEVLAQKTKVLALMHNEVMATAVRCVNRAEKMDNTLDASGKRMLNMARDAFGRIFICAYAYRFSGEKRFLDCAEDLLNQICDFPDWNKQNHYLDTSTLTHAAAVGYDWLYDALSAATRAKIEEKVFAYSLDGVLSDAASYINPASGWNTTITSGMILGALAFYEVKPELCNTLLNKAIPSNRAGLQRLLGTDGSDPMGTMYWRNFVQMEMLSVSALKAAYRSDFGTSEYEGYHNTPTWYIHLIGNSGRTFAFGDNNENVDTVPAMFFFSALTGNLSLPYFELQLAETGQVITGGVRVDGGTAVNMRTYPLALLWVAKYPGGAAYSLPEERVHAAIDGRQPVVMARTGWGSEDPYMAIKGGQANLNHAHMDAGSFCYDDRGVRWATDPVQDEYDALEKAIADLNCGDLWDRTDGSARYQAFRINCRQHNTLCVNDTDHLVNGSACFTSVSRDEDAMGATLDLTKALEGQVAEATRTALIKDKSYLSVTEHIRALAEKDASIRWNLCTDAVPTLAENGIVLTLDGKKMLLQAVSAYPLTYKIFTNDPNAAEHPAPFSYAEEYRENEHYCGFTVTIPAGKADDIAVTLKRM